jgi:multidrug efflux pump
VLRLSDVARVELGAADYSFSVNFNGQQAAGLGINPIVGANALDTAKGVYALLDQLRPSFPHGLVAHVALDSTPFIRLSIREVVKTLFEAMVLVVLVMFAFLQNLRATFIPAITVPVVLLGTFAVLYAVGYSINMLTMFAVVLAIGLLVDDAIVVVENVERLMSERGLSPREATRESMDQISGALIGIGTVLAAVFVPMAFLSGATGVIYRQFSVAIVAAMGLSVLVALILTPALCATLLKPLHVGEHGSERGVFRWFNRNLDRSRDRYVGVVGRMLRHTARYMLIYLALAAVMGLLFFRLPTSYLPDEDQGAMQMQVQAPPGATQQRTRRALDEVQSYFQHQEADTVQSIFAVQGFSFAGSGQNVGILFLLLKDWSQREADRLGVQAIAARARRAFADMKDADVTPTVPQAINELGNAAGFDFYLQDFNGQGHLALMAARNAFLRKARQDPKLVDMRATGQDDSPQLQLDVDPQKAQSFGLSMADVNDTLSVAWGGRYIDDFIDRGRVKHVYLQADAPFRMQPQDFGRWYVRSATGQMVPVSAFTSTHWEFGSPRLERYNGVSAVQLNGQAAPGVSSGEAMAEVERLVGELPPGFRLAWTAQSYQEIAAGSQTPLLYSLSLLVVFLCLAGLYESWSIPISILLAVPLGVVGAVLATTIRGLERDVYFQVGMLTTIGLASKNAILIVEFARKYVEQGMELVEATLHAARDRLRPILMTSLAFGFGVLPLAFARGAGAGAQRAIGTGVFGGMVAGTFLGIFFTPVFYVIVQRAVRWRRAPAGAARAPGEQAAPTTDHVSP